ncbi:MAG: TrkA C-terminal domain-containing protein, partial [Muribaculaceae bacterium]|nr:TrkA C-terminal domain-containing protein [Muribaculaceae bacterium]
AVSVITIFTTPYFVKLSQPAYSFVEWHLPNGLNFLIDRYSKQVTDASETKRLWHEILSRYMWRILLYSVVLLAIVLISRQFLFPLCMEYLGEWGRLSATAITFVCMLPFLIALSYSGTKPEEKQRLHDAASFYAVPLVAMRIIRYLITLLFIVYLMTIAYNSMIAWITGLIGFGLIMAFASTKLLTSYGHIEEKFINNLNIRENTRLGLNNKLVSDLHQAFIEVGPNTSFVGDKLKDSGLRSDYGVSVSSIQRGETFIPLPSINARIFPGDILGVIGNDEQIKKLNDDIESAEKAMKSLSVTQPEIALRSIKLSANSPIINVPLGKTNLRTDFYSMIVKVQRGEDEFEQPDSTTVLREGDIVWVVGDASRIDAMK